MQDFEDHTQRCSALVARELARLDIDIAALSEAGFRELCSLKKDGEGYTLFWSGKNKDERRLFGVGFMFKTSIVRKSQNLPIGHSDRLMPRRLPIQDKKFVIVFGVYTPTLQAESGVKEAFYRDLHNFLQQVDSKDKLLILKDFNARIGRDSEPWKEFLGRHGFGNCDDNGRSLLEFYSEHQLVITSTLFQQKDRLKATLRHPRFKHWHPLDYA